MKSEVLRVTHELQAMKDKIKENSEKIKVNKTLPYLVSNVIEVSTLMSDSCTVKLMLRIPTRSDSEEPRVMPLWSMPERVNETLINHSQLFQFVNRIDGNLDF